MAYMSQEGYDKLVAELKRLETIERPKASAAIAEARDKGDLSENSEYDAAKEAQAHLEDKINKLKVTISRQRADTLQGGDDQHDEQRQDDLHHRERERSQPEGGKNLHQDSYSPGLAQQEGGRRGGNQDTPRHHQVANRQNQHRIKDHGYIQQDSGGRDTQL